MRRMTHTTEDLRAAASKGDLLEFRREVGAEFGGVHRRLGSLESDVKVLKSGVKVLKSDVKVLKSDVRNLNGRVGSLEAGQSSLRGEVRELREELGDFRTFTGIQFEEMKQRMDLVIEGYLSQVGRTNQHDRRISAIEEELPVLRAGIAKRR
jgi:chromosome segregation ATPase